MNSSGTTRNVHASPKRSEGFARPVWRTSSRQISRVAALGMPILAENAVEVVLTFFMRTKPRKRDLKSAVDLLSPVGMQLGTIVHRKRLDASLREAYEQHATVELTIDVAIVPADRNRLAEVLDNLLVNALKYACNGSEPQIEIGSLAADGEVRLFVRDNGPGIEAQQHENIFSLFQQLDATREGSGVGLAIVRRIMEVHYGRAWVESTLGEGATFWLVFPALASEGVLSR